MCFKICFPLRRNWKKRTVKNDRIWRDGVNGNTKDFDSFIVGSNPARAAILTLRAVALGGQGFAPVSEGAVRADDNYERNVHYG